MDSCGVFCLFVRKHMKTILEMFSLEPIFICHDRWMDIIYTLNFSWKMDFQFS